jgi:hypothetical protein
MGRITHGLPCWTRPDEAARRDDLVTGLRHGSSSDVVWGEGCPCPLSCLHWASDYGEGLERRVASSPSPQHGATATSRTTVDCNAFNARLCAQRTEHAQKAHRTVYRTCPVHHQTVQRPHLSELQRSEPNGRVTWLAHRIVSGGAPDCPVHHATESPPTATFGGWAINTPTTPTFKSSKFSTFQHLTRAIALNSRHNQRDQILSQVRNHSKSNSD